MRYPPDFFSHNNTMDVDELFMELAAKKKKMYFKKFNRVFFAPETVAWLHWIIRSPGRNRFHSNYWNTANINFTLGFFLIFQNNQYIASGKKFFLWIFFGHFSMQILLTSIQYWDWISYLKTSAHTVSPNWSAWLDATTQVREELHNLVNWVNQPFEVLDVTSMCQYVQFCRYLAPVWNSIP